MNTSLPRFSPSPMPSAGPLNANGDNKNISTASSQAEAELSESSSDPLSSDTSETTTENTAVKLPESYVLNNTINSLNLLRGLDNIKRNQKETSENDHELKAQEEKEEVITTQRTTVEEQPCREHAC